MTVIERAIESAKNRKYKLENDLSHNISDLHRKKANGQKEVMQVTIDALEKQIPKKPIDKSNNPKDWHIMSCPCCGRVFWNSGEFMHYEPKWCEKCGQKIDWSREDD